MKKRLELQLSLWGSCNLKNLSNIVCFSFLFWTLYKQRGVVIQFYSKKFVHVGWANQNVQP
jgi:dipeptide/tripeptide permease